MSATLAPSLRERIGDFQAAYVRCIDHDQLERWPDFFTTDGHYCVTTAANRREGLAAGLMWADNQAMLHDRVTALRHANVYERQRYRHIVGQATVIKQGASALEVETPFMVARIMHDGHTSLFLSGVYEDVLVDGPDGLRLKDRLVVLDSSRIDTLLAVPL